MHQITENNKKTFSFPYGKKNHHAGTVIHVAWTVY